MAKVIIELSEYNSWRKYSMDLKEKVKLLNEQVLSLKEDSRVIVRTIKQNKCCERAPYGGYSEDETVEEVSEEYKNFDDVRSKVEKSMEDEIKSSIDIRKREAEQYRKERDRLQETIGKEYMRRIDILEKEVQTSKEYFDKLYELHDGSFRKINQLSQDVLNVLNQMFFRPSSAIDMVQQIQDLSIERLNKRDL